MSELRVAQLSEVTLESVLKDIIMRLRSPDVAAIDDVTAERLIRELGLAHA